MMKLTKAICKDAKGKAKPYKRFDGRGLYLEVMPNGSKLWRLKYRFMGKEKRLSLGAFPLVSLAKAREQRAVIKEQLKAGIDPSAIRREKKKNRPKPQSNKNVFNISLSEDGVLTIETTSRILHLSAAQTETLGAFLKAAPLTMKGTKT